MMHEGIISGEENGNSVPNRGLPCFQPLCYNRACVSGGVSRAGTNFGSLSSRKTVLSSKKTVTYITTLQGKATVTLYLVFPDALNRYSIKGDATG